MSLKDSILSLARSGNYTGAEIVRSIGASRSHVYKTLFRAGISNTRKPHNKENIKITISRIEIGKEYGWLTVLRKTAGGRITDNGIRKRISTKYLCKCRCGKEIEVFGFNLASGNSRSCGCKPFTKWNFVDLTGKTFGGLTVLRRSEAFTKTRGTKWVCKCTCGREVEIASNCLTSGNNRTCGDKKQHKSPKMIGEIPQSHLNYIRNNATKRNLLFDLNPDFLWELFLKQNRKCALSGVTIGFGYKNWEETTASLDRIDSKVGYILGNVRWIHKYINKMRGPHSDTTFLDWCKKCINYTKHKSIPCWHDYFFEMIDVIKLRSPDPNTKVGCVIVGTENQVLSTGYNGLPFGVKTTPDRLERPAKYEYIAHGERNSIDLAARSGVCLKGSKIYVSLMPCIECARGIIQAGIAEIIIDHEAQQHWITKTTKYANDYIRVEEMLKEAKVNLIRWNRLLHQEHKE